MTDSVPIPNPREPLTSGDFISRVWLRALQGVTTQALGGTVTKIMTGNGLSGGPIVGEGTVELAGKGADSLTLNGQLLIGDSITRTAEVGTLTQGANVTITNGPGTIQIDAAGAADVLTADGELLIGDTSLGHGVVGVLTAGTNITVTNGGGSITIAAAGAADALTADGDLWIGDTALGHGIVATLTPGRGISITNGGGSISISGQAPAATQTTPTNPIGTTSTTAVMVGLAAAITPVFSTRVHLTISGSCANSIISDGGTVQLSYGTGTAPANGAALTGTQVGSLQEWTAAVAGGLLPFSATAIITGLTPGTPYWLDAAVAAVIGGTATISNLSVSAMEI